VSNALAIATLTGVLETRAQTLIDEAGIGSIKAQATHPTGADKPGVYLHAYQILPNAELRNQTMPERRSDASSVRAPRLAVDAYYLFSFIGNKDTLEAEQLAGIVMTGLNKMPILTGTEISEYIKSLPGGHALKESDLAEQVERVRVTPLSLDLEELSRLWGMFGQSFHRLSIAYRASVLMLDAEVEHGPALPVTTRGLTTFPMRAPRITSIEASTRELPVVQFGEDIVVHGHALRGDSTWLRVGETLLEITDASDGEIIRTFDTGSGLGSGVVSVQVVHKVVIGDGTTREGAESNAAPLSLIPTVAMNSTPVAAGPKIRLDVEPKPGAEQSIELLLVGTSGEGRFASKQWEFDGNVVEVTVPDLIPGTYLVRLNIDGAITLLGVDSGTGKFNSPQVTVS